jgi:hypothetical protein
VLYQAELHPAIDEIGQKFRGILSALVSFS